MTDHSRMCEPALATISPTCSLTVYLQQQFPDYFQDVFGIPGSVSAVSENTPPIDDLTGLSEASDCCPKPADQYQITGMCSSTPGPGIAENTNANSLVCGQQVPVKSATAPQQKSLKVNVCKKGQVNVSKESSRTRHPLLTCVTESAVADLSRKMELWLGKLKTDIQTDINRIINQALEIQRQCHHVQTIEMMAERQQLEWKVNELKEKAQTCSERVEEKNAVIDNILEMLARQKNRQVLVLAFSLTKAGHMDAKAEKYAECLATLHYEHQLTQKVLRAWFGLVTHRWKSTLEALYSDRAESTCRQLSCDYQKTVTVLNEEISHLKAQLEHMHQERQMYVMHVKKAFLRGVCALNTETMSAFTLDDVHNSDCSTGTKDASNSSSDGVDISEGDNCFIKSLPQDQIFPSVVHLCQPARATDHPAKE